MKRFVSSLFFFFIVASGLAQVKRSPEITVDELRQHLKYLSSDELEGRRAGSRGADKAAVYIANEFKQAGLSPKGDNGTFFQEFEFVSGVHLGKSNSLAIRFGTDKLPAVMNQDFRTLDFSSRGEAEGEVVFAGYGISAADKKYDDYEGIDVQGKITLVLRYHPEGDNPHSEFTRLSDLRTKVSRAKERGAGAILLVTGPADDKNDQLMNVNYNHPVEDAGIPAFNVTRRWADKLLSADSTTLKQLQERINSTKKPHSFRLRSLARVFAEIEPVKAKSRNVIGFLEGSDPDKRQEIVVIGAHYDHLGFGGVGSGSLKPDTSAVHNGADDNGSGTSGLIELAQAFAARRSELKRSLLFIAFTGEEMGLLGSAYFVKNPTVPLGQLVAMLNMDMIGRLTDRKLIVYGVGTSSGFQEVAERFNKDSMFVLRLNKDGYGPSDHSSFYAKKIPVFHFFTDLHSDYHRPSDDWEKINLEGMQRVLTYIRNVAQEIATEDKRPDYVEVESPRPQGEIRGFRAYVGTIPDYGEQADGMKISGVREGSPAAKAGLRGGDIIIKFGKVDVKNVYDYTFALGEYKPGDEVEVVFKRGTETLRSKVILETRN